MKHWQELGEILDRVLSLADQGRPAALATVTRIRGSAYRRPGARLLVQDDGAVLGGVSGGCLEEDVREVGMRVLRDGRSRTLHYETGGDDARVWGLGLGCDGAVDLAVQAIVPAARETWARVRALLDGDAPFALVSVVEDGGSSQVLAMGESGRLAGRMEDAAAERAAEAAGLAALRARVSTLHADGGRMLFAEVLVPPPDLLVFGAGDDARPLAAFAAAAGFRVTVVDHRDAYLTRERFPAARKRLKLRPDDDPGGLPLGGRAYAVVKTHSLERDTGWVRRLAETDVPYIGVLGPRARTGKMLARLPARARDRVFGPVGLDLGADGPEQVALSILAELLAVRSGREPRHLRERPEAVHA